MIQLELNTAVRADERSAGISQPQEAVDADGIGGDQFAEIQVQLGGVRANLKQFRHVGVTEMAGQPHHSTVTVLNDTNPAIHARTHFANPGPMVLPATHALYRSKTSRNPSTERT